MDQPDINPTAIEKLKNLNSEFMAAFSAAANKQRGFFDSWFDDRQGVLEEYSHYNKVAGGALNDLTLFGKKDEAVQALTDLKAVFDNRAAACEKSQRGFFASWTGEDKKQADKYKDYATTVADVLKLI